MNWKEYLSRKKIEIIITTIFLAGILFILPKFLAYIELREGVVFHDPILNLFKPVDLTWFIFALIYFSLLSAMIYFSSKPELLFTAIQSYIVLVIFRIIVMYLTPLDAPLDSIILEDPFVQLFGSGKILTKDLFFSGHTATLFLLYLTADKKYLKFSYLILTLLVGLAVLIQHVHYTIDVIAAFVFAYVSFKIVFTFRNNIYQVVRS